MAKLYSKNTWTDETLADDPRYTILEDAGTAFKDDMQINLKTAVTQAGTTADAAHMNNIEDGLDAVDTRLDTLETTTVPAIVQTRTHAADPKNPPVDADEIPLADSAATFGLKKLTWANIKATLKTYFDALYLLPDGWFSAGTWTRASDTTFTVAGDQTAVFTSGLKLKWTQNSTVKYAYVLSSAYTSSTTVTITGGSDFVLTNAQAISATYYSREANPAGFPHWFNWVPDLTTGNADLSGYTTARFRISDHSCFIVFIADSKNFSGSGGTFKITLPVAATVAGMSYWPSAAYYISSFIVIRAYVVGAVMEIWKDINSTTWVANETGVYFRIMGSYEIA